MSANIVFFKAINVLAIVGLLLSLIGNLITWYFWNFILAAILKIFLVVCLILIEFRQSPSLVKPFSFMFFFLGRGVFYLTLGFVSMGIDILSIIGSFILVLVGIIYITFHFTNRNGEPEFMSFVRYRRLTSGLSHELPTTSSVENGSALPKTYPVAHQVPLDSTAPSE
ncbi:COPI associated protein-domain-containing protein [Parasitella parasitica]|nr:COPI associated protein-domain-containing protein [Parasitella parasitica]